ncbi:HutD/Ves family protein [Marinomonas atlantica]|uniref:HutD/Ves family protein n=1 Tax=Marinomonas atlantica TaxID=1806668 RepID=UPI0008312986|nr:HutD family protein [Marinomonas atlantica]
MPSLYRIISPTQYKRMPWKNGLGETLEIVRLEDAIGVRFRLSQAAVIEDGMFSFFDGLQRTLVMLSGNGMMLSHQSDRTCHPPHVLNCALDQASFSGGDKTYAALTDGPIEDLNIMVRQVDTVAHVATHSSPMMLKSEADVALFEGLYAQSDYQIVINVAGRAPEVVSVLKDHTVHMLAAAELTLVSGSGIWVTVTATPRIR